MILYYFINYLKSLIMKKFLVSIFFEDCKEYFAPLDFPPPQDNNDVTKVARYLNNLKVTSADVSLYDGLLDGLLECFTKNDQTQKILELEDYCLFIKSNGEVLNTVLRYLEMTKDGKELPAYAFLDSDKNAVVNFFYDDGWQAALFCKCDKDFSALHLSDYGFTAVVFKTDISQYQEKAQLEGSVCLKEYMPRELGDFLSKKANRTESISENNVQGRHDKGDLL